MKVDCSSAGKGELRAKSMSPEAPTCQVDLDVEQDTAKGGIKLLLDNYIFIRILFL